jgi:hypothetical protein
MPAASPRIALKSCRWIRLLLGLALVLAVPGFGQAAPTGWRVAEEEEQSERDSSESIACATADGLRLRGRSVAPGKWLPPRVWSEIAGLDGSRSHWLSLRHDWQHSATASLNGCGAFLRC